MIAAFLKKGFPADIEQPLAQFIKAEYGNEKAEELAAKLKEINELRKSCIINESVYHPDSDIDRHTQYYHLLNILDQRFPFAKGSSGWFRKIETVMVLFRWCDAYVPSQISQNYSIKFEKMCILYNLAALHSIKAVKRQSSGEEGLAEAVGLFRNAASAFQYVAMQDESVGLACTLDIQKESASMLSTFMIAQAQACFFEMACKKKTSPGLLAKLAMGSAELFETTYQMIITKEGLKQWLRQCSYSYEDHIKFQINCYKAAAHYWNSQAMLKSSEEDCHGKEIARLTLASKYLQQAAELSKKVVPALETSRKNLAERLVGPRLEQATKDNLLIYFEVVPNVESLPPIEGKQNVQIENFSLNNTLEDPFKNLITKTVQKKAEKIRINLKANAKSLSDSVNQQTADARAMLASLGLPASLESIETEKGLPDSVWNRVVEIQKSGGVQAMELAYNRIESMNTTICEMHKRITTQLDTEERLYNEIIQKIGSNWKVIPSFRLNSHYREELKTISHLLNQAMQCNKKLKDLIYEDRQQFKDLEKSREQIDEVLLRLLNNESNENQIETSKEKLLNVAEILKGWLDELNTCIGEREQLKQQYIVQVESMDVNSFLMTKENASTNISTTTTEEKRDDTDVNAEVVKELQEIENKIQSTYINQEKLLKYIVQANNDFMKLKTSTFSQKNRETFIHNLNQTCERFHKYKLGLEDGLQFYSDLLTEYLNPLNENVDKFILSRTNERRVILLENMKINEKDLKIDGSDNPIDNSTSQSLLTSSNEINSNELDDEYVFAELDEQSSSSQLEPRDHNQQSHGIYPPYYDQPSNPFYGNNNNK